MKPLYTEMFNLLKSIHSDYTNGHIEDLDDLEEKIIQILLKSATETKS